MSVGAIAATTQTGAAATPAAGQTAAGAAKLDCNAFLQLLIAQMKNQDPIEPMKASDYAAQLATFSQVEKSVQMNDRLGALLTSSQPGQAEGLIGRTVTSSDGTISGVATSAGIGSDGVVAVLADGRELTLAPGVTVSAGPR